MAYYGNNYPGLWAVNPLTSGMGAATTANQDLLGALSAMNGVGQTASAVGQLAPAASGLSVLGPIGAGLGGAASLAGTIYGLTQLGQETDAERVARHRWEKASGVSRDLAEQLFYMPQAEGIRPHGQRAEDVYQFAPTEAYQKLASTMLNRQYGLPENIAAGFVAQSQAPYMAQPLPDNVMPSQIQSINPVDLSKAMLTSDQTGQMRQLDYAGQAANLAGYNLWRAQQLQSLLG